MNYRAACPHCASVFRLGDDQLAAAQGWVQCGVCGVAFDARLTLLMEDGSTLPRASDPEPPAPEPLPQPETPAATVVEPDIPPAPPEMAQAPEPPPAPTDEPESPTAIELPRGVREREDPLDLPSIILIDPNLPSYDEPGPMPVIRPEPAPTVIVAPPTHPAPAPLPAARIEYAQPAPTKPVRPARRRKLNPWIGGLLALLLVLALLAQLAWFQRDTLATQFPQTRPMLDLACAQLGCTLSLPKQLDQIHIVGSDLTTEANGQLRLVLTLGNRARHVMAWPVLVLTLTDQAGRPLARRSFAPSEYLADPERIRAGLPPLAEHPLSLPLAVQNLAPMGFDLRLAY